MIVQLILQQFRQNRVRAEMFFRSRIKKLPTGQAIGRLFSVSPGGLDYLITECLIICLFLKQSFHRMAKRRWQILAMPLKDIIAFR